ncbi:hypothetical protein PUN28_000810 [Cardiocondyla obscurior]|uniref:Secreted protein n=1 Tax=Cardiocondyla obscurior TaxID=286306 RepID=A0AAW2H152_9HYME
MCACLFVFLFPSSSFGGAIGKFILINSTSKHRIRVVAVGNDETDYFNKIYNLLQCYVMNRHGVTRTQQITALRFQGHVLLRQLRFLLDERVVLLFHYNQLFVDLLHPLCLVLRAVIQLLQPVDDKLVRLAYQPILQLLQLSLHYLPNEIRDLRDFVIFFNLRY